MKVFLDTNVLASALGTRGLCADLLREVIATEELVVSKPLFTELRRVLLKKFHVPETIVAEAIDFLQGDAIQSPEGDLAVIDIRDKDDIIILSSALRSKAEVFVTGDKEVLTLKRIGHMEILTPRGFWDKIRKKRS